LSRSRAPQCSGGRGCFVCGDAGEVRRDREDELARVDERQLVLDVREFDCEYCTTSYDDPDEARACCAVDAGELGGEA
jgi:hypothetical protein